MFTRRISRLVLMWATPCLLAAGVAILSVPAEANEISWRTTGTRSTHDGNHYTHEGTSVFMNGEEAHIRVEGTVGEKSTAEDGTAVAQTVFVFKDGSSFTLKFVSIWTRGISRNAGIFMGGTGRFAGMTGSGTAIVEKPSGGPPVTVWTGSYELAAQ